MMLFQTVGDEVTYSIDTTKGKVVNGEETDEIMKVD
jgi:hypothetical protein